MSHSQVEVITDKDYPPVAETPSTGKLADFALKYGVNPIEAVCLPALIDYAAAEVGMTGVRLLDRAMNEEKVGEYLASVARNVTEQAVTQVHCDSCKDDVLLDCHDCEQHQHWLEDSKK